VRKSKDVTKKTPPIKARGGARTWYHRGDAVFGH